MSLDSDDTIVTSAPDSRGGGLGLIAAACLVALGLGVGGYWVGQALEKGAARPIAPTITAMGQASHAVRADLAYWPLRVVATGNDLGAVQAKADNDRRALQSYFKEEGLDGPDVALQNMTVVDLLARPYRAVGDGDNRFVVYADLSVRTTKLDAVDRALRKMDEWVRSGIILTTEGMGPRALLAPQYILTRPQELRAQLVGEAVRAAQQSAQKMAAETGLALGPVQKIDEGALSVAPSHPAPGVMEESQIEKDVRLNVTATYTLRAP